MEPSIAELLSLEGRTALVTGAATGIGESLARVAALPNRCFVETAAALRRPAD